MIDAAGSRLDARTQRRVDDVVDEIRALRLDAPAILPRLAPMLAELLGYSSACLYRPLPTVDGYALGDLVMTGPIEPDAVLAAYAAETDEGRAFAGYDPLRPSRAQRNRVLEPKRVIPREQVYPTVMARVQRRVAVHHLQELRVVVCDRRSALAWMGGYRAAPYESRDVAVLARIAAALRPRLAMEAQLRLRATTPHLDLEATDAALVLVLVRDRDRTVAHANAAGRAWLASAGARDHLQAALDGAPGLRTTAQRIAHGAGHTLVSLAPQSAASPRWRDRATRWNLSPRQSEVLAHLVSGDSNETIAAELGVGLRTVERHVAAIALRARVDSRAALVGAALGRP